MLMSDHLDMVGVELRATHTHTRKVNGDIIQEDYWGMEIREIYATLTENTYCLSKVWYKSNVINLRVADISSINSKVKSWLYADQFEIIFRPTSSITIYSLTSPGLTLAYRPNSVKNSFPPSDMFTYKVLGMSPSWYQLLLEDRVTITLNYITLHYKKLYQK